MANRTSDLPYRKIAKEPPGKVKRDREPTNSYQPAAHRAKSGKGKHFERQRQADHLRSGVPDQPGQHSKIPSLLKIQKLAKHAARRGRACWLTPIIPALWEAKASGSFDVRSSRPAWPTGPTKSVDEAPVMNSRINQKFTGLQFESKQKLCDLTQRLETLGFQNGNPLPSLLQDKRVHNLASGCTQAMSGTPGFRAAPAQSWQLHCGRGPAPVTSRPTRTHPPPARRAQVGPQSFRGRSVEDNQRGVRPEAAAPRLCGRNPGCARVAETGWAGESSRAAPTLGARLQPRGREGARRAALTVDVLPVADVLQVAARVLAAQVRVRPDSSREWAFLRSLGLDDTQHEVVFPIFGGPRLQLRSWSPRPQERGAGGRGARA
ncbi:LOW QUALITY PROTEIN: putative uncharacterized protein C8orf44 [Plecturocebus cupreus]